jgi:hypothetical protein
MTGTPKISTVGKQRLLKLADFLEKLPRERKFDMGVVAELVDDGRPACGSSACALGWGACIPSFRRAGYRLTRTGGLRVRGSFSVWFDENAAFFFGISVRDALSLFGMRQDEVMGEPARRAAVKRLREFVKCAGGMP